MTDLSLDMELKELNLSAHIEESDAEQSNPANNVTVSPKAKRKAAHAYAFDYTGVSSAVAKEAEATATRIRERTRAHIIDTGNELLNIKQKLQHGKFGKWLEFHFGWKERTAQNYMNSATAFRATPEVLNVLPPSTIYKLAAKSTPDAVRDSVIEEIKHGGTPDPKNIAKRIAQIKTEARHKANSGDDSRAGGIYSAKNDLVVDRTVGGTLKDPIAAEAPTGDNGMSAVSSNMEVSHTVSPHLNAQLQERQAKKITEHLMKRFGHDFAKLRKMICATDFDALKKALNEA
ncbi:DUF3102 domain-containing protein [Ensifer adhaerens]|uniref:DUF3102 domain-containing protein n=1 Tax=Ensifer canadensis TaxID=555315 RepID=UPI00148F6812|nr:DUF3102 domain-containing protein [Ensifer canadensis]NOV15433.1 DUF3102 domain-containing protein [Ensifer canadensis]